MNLVGLMPVRNEDWVLGVSLRVALMWCDRVIVLDHASTDRTPEIISEVAAENPDRVQCVQESSPVWNDMANRQRLLHEARLARATHLAIIDADEVLTANFVEDIRHVVTNLRQGGYVQTAMIPIWRDVTQFRNDGSIWSKGWITLAVGHSPRLAWQSDNGYHLHHREPYYSHCDLRLRRNGGVMHLQWLPWRRLKAKHALYKMRERIEFPNKPVPEIESLYNLALNEKDIVCQETNPIWWDKYSHLLQYLDPDREPWQERECQKLFETHGCDKFLGLNLFGVVEQDLARV